MFRVQSQMFRVACQNFLTFKTLDFDFADRGLTLITGDNKDQALEKSNGAGKTNLICALAWGLYGKIDKIKNADKVVYNKAGKDCWVEVSWGEYKVIRYRKDTRFKNDVQVYKNGIPETSKSNKDTQDLIDKIVGLSYESFIHSIYFQQSTLTTFATATDSEQKQIIENILNMGVLSYAQDECKEVVKSLNIEISKVEVEANKLIMLKEDCESRSKQLEIMHQKFEQQKQTQIANIELQIKNLQDKRNQSNTHSDFDIEKSRMIVAMTANYPKEIKELENEMLQLNVEKRKAEKLEQENLLNLRMAQNKVARLKEDLVRILKTDTGKCSLCGQGVPKKFGEEQITNLQTDIQKAEEDVKLWELTKSSPVSSEDARLLEINSTISKKRELIDMANRLNQKILQAEYSLKEISMIDSHIQEARERKDELTAQLSPYGVQIKSEQAKIDDYVEKILVVLQDIQERKIERSYYEYWVDGLANSKLKSYIMDSITPILNERANYYSQILTNGAYFIDISTQTKLKSGELRDKFAVNVKTADDTDYEQCSGGQRKRVDVCILLALQDLVASRAKQPLQLLVMDEVSENLDEVGVERMLELLKKITSDKGSCFYITHDESMKPLFPNSISVTKENGVSTVYG